MKVHQKVLWVVGLVALGAFSLAGFFLYVGLIPRMTAYRALTAMWDEPAAGLTAGAVFLFLLALSIYLPISIWLRGAGKVVTISNPLGPVDISTEAISKSIQRAAEKVEKVEGVNIKVMPAGEGVKSSVTLAACSDIEGGIPRLVSSFQEMVKKYLIEQVGVASVEKIDVKVTKILQEQVEE